MKVSRRARRLKVVKLKTTTDADRQEMIDILERELEAVRSGFTASLAIATVDRNGATYCDYYASRWKGSLLGSVMLMQHAMLTTNANDWEEEHGD